MAVVAAAFCTAGFAQDAQAPPPQGHTGSAGPATGQATTPPAAGQTPSGQTPSGQTPSGQPEKKVKDRQEYDLYEAARTATDPNKRLDALNQWTQKYPDTDYKKERLLLYMQAYQQQNQTPKVVDTANQILALDPTDFTSLYTLASIVPVAGDTSAGRLALAEKAGNGMLQNLDATFAADKRQPSVSAAQWAQARTDAEALAHKTLGWTAMQRKQTDAAQQELTKSLQVNPNDATVSYWLATTLYATKDPAKLSDALYDYARAVTYDGPGALTPEGKKQIDDFLTKAYKGYHGSLDGLDQLKAQAKTSPLPPAGFHIKSVTEIAEEAQKKADAEAVANPNRTLWRNVHDQLEKDPNYFAQMKDSQIPNELTGKVVSSTTKELVLSMFDDPTQDVTLKLTEGTFPKVEAGKEITFKNGIPKAFTPSPFMLTMETEKKDITGLPKAAAPVHHAPARRRR